MADILKQNSRLRTKCNWKHVEIFNIFNHRIAIKKDLIGTEVCRARSREQISLAQCAHNIHRNKIARKQFVLIEINQDRSILAADNNRRDATWHCAKHVANVDSSNIFLSRIIQPGICDSQNSNWQCPCRIKRKRNRGKRVWRKIRQSTKRKRIRQCQRFVGIDVIAKINLHNAHTRN